MIFLVLILPSISRAIEAYRDAEAFELPIDSRSTTWHILKFPQFGIWAIWGASLVFSTNGFIFALVSLIPARFIFEWSLRFFRKRYKKYFAWDIEKNNLTKEL